MEWNIDTCLPFGTCHGSQSVQHLSDTVHFLIDQEGFCVINYIDDYIGVGIPRIEQRSFEHLLTPMKCLGVSISQSKLVPPSTKVVCLGFLIDRQTGTISIPPDKLHQINDTN